MKTDNIIKLNEVAKQLDEGRGYPNRAWFTMIEKRISSMESLKKQIQGINRFEDMDLDGDAKATIESIDEAIRDVEDLKMAIEYDMEGPSDGI